MVGWLESYDIGVSHSFYPASQGIVPASTLSGVIYSRRVRVSIALMGGRTWEGTMATDNTLCVFMLPPI